VLSRCISVDPGVFAAEYWGRKPLLSKADALPRDFCDLLSPDMVDELLVERGVRAPFIRLAKEGELLAKSSYLGPAGFGAEIADQVDSAKVVEQLESGSTVVLQGLHRLWPPLIDFVRRAVDDIGHPVQANAYITPTSNRGFDFHYDVHDVFVLQVAGRKRWVVHEPVHAHPLPSQPWTSYRDRIAERVTDEPVIDTVLEQGDALYLPRGWVHAARALDTTSIHLTIGVSVATAIDVARAVVDQLAEVEDFRAALPMVSDTAGREEITPSVAKVVALMADLLRDDGTAIGAAAAERLTARFASQTRAEGIRPLATMDAVARADSVPVRWRHGMATSLDRAAGGRAVLRSADKTMTFPSSCLLALQALRSSGVFDAAALPGLDTVDASVLIRRLLREGVVVPADADH
jgi:ribosomal protein L16 Arg81 hydroxylase